MARRVADLREHDHRRIISTSWASACSPGAASRGWPIDADVVIVNTAFAMKFFDGASPLGRTVWLGLEQTPHEVIGVVNDTKLQSLRSGAPSMMYLDVAEGTTAEHGHAAYRSQRRATAVARPSWRGRSGNDSPAVTSRCDRSTSRWTTPSRPSAPRRRWPSSSACLGLLLAAVGLYGVLSREVQSRTPEIAVRMALGAEPKRVGSLVVFRILAATVAGLIAGVGLSVAAEQVVRSLLYEVQPSDAGQLVDVHRDHRGCRGCCRGRAGSPRHARRSDDGAAFRVTAVQWPAPLAEIGSPKKAKRPSHKASGVSMRVMRVPVVAGTLT